MVDVGRVEGGVPRAFEATHRLPTNLTGFVVFKASRNMFRADEEQMADVVDGAQGGIMLFLHTLVFGYKVPP